MKSDPVTDEVGKKTLYAVGEANRFNKWMFETIIPFSDGKILEVGSGLGNISEFFLERNFQIRLTDLREDYLHLLQEKFGPRKNLLGVDQLDLAHPNFDKIYRKHLEQYDTVFALNVLEHIQDDQLAISNCKKLLKKSGILIILVPSYQKLYNKFDQGLGHFRRYNKTTLSNLFTVNDFNIIHSQYFNVSGIFGWYLSGNILKKETIAKPFRTKRRHKLWC